MHPERERKRAKGGCKEVYRDHDACGPEEVNAVGYLFIYMFI